MRLIQKGVNFEPRGRSASRRKVSFPEWYSKFRFGACFPTRPRRHEIIERGGVTVLFGGTVLDTIISDSHYNGCDLFIGRNFLVKKVGFAALVETTENLRADFAASECGRITLFYQGNIRPESAG